MPFQASTPRPRPLLPAVAQLAEDLHATSELLSCLLEAVQGGSAVAPLPSADVRIGCYRYDAAERGRNMSLIYARLEATYCVSERCSNPLPVPCLAFGGGLHKRAVLLSRDPEPTRVPPSPGSPQVEVEVLRISLQSCTLVAAALQHQAGHLLTPRLTSTLLGAEFSQPSDVKRGGLLLIATALSYCSLAAERTQGPQLSVDEMNARRQERLRVCEVRAPGPRGGLPALRGWDWGIPPCRLQLSASTSASSAPSSPAGDPRRGAAARAAGGSRLPAVALCGGSGGHGAPRRERHRGLHRGAPVGPSGGPRAAGRGGGECCRWRAWRAWIGGSGVGLHPSRRPLLLLTSARRTITPRSSTRWRAPTPSCWSAGR